MSRNLIILATLCVAALASPRTEKVGDIAGCTTCNFVASSARSYINANPNITLVRDWIVNTACNAMTEEYVCDGLVKELSEVTWDALLDHYTDASWICSMIGQCDSPKYAYSDFEEWATELLSTKPKYYAPSRRSTTVRFAHITDIGIDPLYKEGTESLCLGDLCCRESTSGETFKSKAGAWGDYNCDLPYKTFAAGVKALHASEPELDFIVWTGNTAPHDYYNLTYIEKQQLISKATDELLDNFNAEKTPVYPVLGGLDCNYVEQYNFKSESQLNGFLANQWRSWLPKEAIAQIYDNGSYATMHKDTNLKIIGLNTQACSYKNMNLFRNVTDPGQQLQWLRHELHIAEEQDQTVYILGSLPAGDRDCLEQWGIRYNALIDRYQKTVVGQFYGHVGKDIVMVNRGVKTQDPVGAMFVAPPMGTYKKNNPSFRVYEADSKSFALVNYDQYRMNLKTANTYPTLSPAFEKAYTFRSEYLVGSMEPSYILSWIEDMRSDELESLKYLYNKYTYGPGAPLSCDEQCRQDNACDSAYAVNSEINDCKEMTESPIVHAMSLAYGPWVYKVTGS